MKVNKKRFLFFLLVTALTITSLIGCTPTEDKSTDVEENTEKDIEGDDSPKDEVELYLSVAASLTDAVNELKDIYEDMHPEITLNPSYASSGDLQTQIEEGAPSDIFISAAQKQMDVLEEKNLIEDGTRETLLINKVVLITPKDSELDINSIEDLGKDEVKQIAIGDPVHVPVGQYSEEIFENLNLTDGVNDKLVLANTVRLVLDWVEAGEVDAGLVYMTDAMTSDSINIVTEAPKDSHKEVSYPIGMIEYSENKNEAQDFLDFIYTDKAKEVLEKYGFTIN